MGAKAPFFYSMKKFAFLLLLLFPAVASGQASDTIKFSVTVNERVATVHYSGTPASPVGIGAYSTKKTGWGPKFAIRSFVDDGVTTGTVQIQNQTSGIRVILPGRYSPLAQITSQDPIDKAFKKGTVIGSKSYQRSITGGAVRTFKNGVSVFVEVGGTLSRNYQKASVEGKTLFRKHPKGYRTIHPNIGLGAAVRFQDHVSAQLGYNFIAGKLPKSHNLQFGIGFTNFL